MPRPETIQNEVQRLMRAVPFRPFALNLENGDRVIIDHPGNIAFDPSIPAEQQRAGDFYVISGGLRLFNSFEAVTALAILDREGGVTRRKQRLAASVSQRSARQSRHCLTRQRSGRHSFG